MTERGGVTLPVLPVALPPADPLDATTIPSQRRSSNRQSMCSSSSSSGEQVRRLQRENARLKEELDSLKAMFARRIATDESAFEQKLMAKDLDCERWFKSKKDDLRRIQAGSVIMKSIFDARRRKFAEDMTRREADFANQQAQWQQEYETMQEQLKKQEEDNSKQIEWTMMQAEKKQHDTEKEKASVEAQNRLLVQELQAQKEECEQLRKEQLDQSQALDRLRERLLHVERADELLKRNSQIEALEAELKRTKKMITERSQGEADALRRELMEYVKFIVHILPEEWANKVKEQDSLRLGAPVDSKHFLPTAPGSDSRSSQNPRSKKRFQSRASHAVYPSPYLQAGNNGGAGAQMDFIN